MTVFAKPSRLHLSQEILIKPLSPQIDLNEPRYTPRQLGAEEKMIMVDEKYSLRRYSRRGITLSVFITMLIMTFMILVASGLVYQRILHDADARSFRGHCAVPILNNDGAEKYRVPLQWTTEPTTPVLSTPTMEDLMSALHEQLDLGVTVEKISVVNNGHHVNFIHDFNDNTTGIVDDDRCFIMGLNPEVVLTPELFISGLKQGGQFDVSRVRSSMRAALPSVEDVARVAYHLLGKCSGKPVYYLQQNEGTVIRKREVADPKHDYMHFSGKHVFELKIDNLPEILAYEKNIKQK